MEPYKADSGTFESSQWADITVTIIVFFSLSIECIKLNYEYNCTVMKYFF